MMMSIDGRSRKEVYSFKRVRNKNDDDYRYQKHAFCFALSSLSKILIGKNVYQKLEYVGDHESFMIVSSVLNLDPCSSSNFNSIPQSINRISRCSLNLDRQPILFPFQIIASSSSIYSIERITIGRNHPWKINASLKVFILEKDQLM